jgi:hypothetical protein
MDYTTIDFSFLENPIITTNDEDLADKIEKTIIYLINLKEPSKLLLESKSFTAISFLKLNLVNILQLNLILKFQNILEIFSNILFHSLNDIKSYLNSYDTLNEETIGIEKVYLTQYQINSNILTIIWNGTNRSKEFKYKFYEYRGFEAILNYIADEKFIQNCIRFKETSNQNRTKSQPPGLYFLRASIGSLNNMSKIADDKKMSLHELNAASILMKFATIMKDFPSHRMSAYMASANILNDNEIETLPDTKLVVEDIVSLIKIGATAIQRNRNLIRASVSIDDREESPHETVCIIKQYHIVELLQVLYKIAVNDKIKMELYENYMLKDYLEKIILHGNLTEKEYSLKLLWQFCFQKLIAKKIHENVNLYKHIEDLFGQADLENKNVKKYAKGIIWSIENIENLKENEVNFERKKHVMISYNRDSRNLCLTMKRELEKLGFKVWIDIDEIHGSSLEAMANAIEESKCVLICMTEKYKQSPNCRAVSILTLFLENTLRLFHVCLRKPNMHSN